ncbi:protein LBH [Erinaceus europaeus]|uniref:Protein LBH n=1 Tax=Erinaceus europaeus TaxID=9365 RepID=A0A1S3WCY5_ERIEU|nr:protein LBH [Erinaceus europaeus]
MGRLPGLFVGRELGQQHPSCSLPAGSWCPGKAPPPAAPPLPRHPPRAVTLLSPKGVGHLPEDFMSVYFPLHCLRSVEMTEVMMNTPAMEEIGLSPRKDGLSYQIFPDPSDFDRCCKLKDRLPSIVVEPTEGEVESGELRWPPEEFLVPEDEQDNCEETVKETKEQ